MRCHRNVINAQAYAAGWGVRRDFELAYFWALHAERKKPGAIDLAPFANSLNSELRKSVEQRASANATPTFRIARPEIFVLPNSFFDDGGKANPFRTAGLAPCSPNSRK
jgi:hypothetical protein